MNKYQILEAFCKESNVELVAVSKTKPNSAILELYDQGQRIFGENRVQELDEKHKALPKDIAWHMIGHLQTNKVKYIAPYVNMIHSGERKSLLKEINKEAIKNERFIDVLLQIKIAKEESKFGWNTEELMSLLDNGTKTAYPNINYRGVMGMATFTDDKEQVKSEFDQLKAVYDLLKSKYFEDQIDFDTISMGMSGDYKLAVESGSTMIRVGSLLFGARS